MLIFNWSLYESMSFSPESRALDLWLYMSRLRLERPKMWSASCCEQDFVSADVRTVLKWDCHILWKTHYESLVPNAFKKKILSVFWKGIHDNQGQTCERESKTLNTLITLQTNRNTTIWDNPMTNLNTCVPVFGLPQPHHVHHTTSTNSESGSTQLLHVWIFPLLQSNK